MNTSVAPLLRFLLLASALVISTACRAQAHPHPSPLDQETSTRSVTVSWADLNLASPQGTQVLYKRIKAAARIACTGLEVDRVYEAPFRRTCFEEAVDKAIAKVSDPHLTALHRAAKQAPFAPAARGVWARESGHPG